MEHSILLPGDVPLIIASIVCFVSFIVYGAAVGALGASIPELGSKFERTEASFGFAFTTRGIGYLCGTLGSAALLKYKSFSTVPKELFTAVAVCLTGLSTGLVMAVGRNQDFSIVLFLFWLQGLAFFNVLTIHSNKILFLIHVVLSHIHQD